VKNFEYYTELPFLPYKDYGRNVVRLIEEIKKLPDKEQRNYYVKQVLRTMSIVNPQNKDMVEYKKKLWHHLFVLANHELDVDCPYDLSELEKEISDLPHEKLNYYHAPPKFRQYGKNIEILISKVIEMPDGEEKNKQVEAIANLMKICAQKTSDEKIDDETIFQHLAILSDGKLVLNKNQVTLQAVSINKNKSKNKRKFKNNSKNKKFFYNKNKK